MSPSEAPWHSLCHQVWGGVRLRLGCLVTPGCGGGGLPVMVPPFQTTQPSQCVVCRVGAGEGPSALPVGDPQLCCLSGGGRAGHGWHRCFRSGEEDQRSHLCLAEVEPLGTWMVQERLCRRAGCPRPPLKSPSLSRRHTCRGSPAWPEAPTSRRWPVPGRPCPGQPHQVAPSLQSGLLCLPVRSGPGPAGTQSPGVHAGRWPGPAQAAPKGTASHLWACSNKGAAGGNTQ